MSVMNWIVVGSAAFVCLVSVVIAIREGYRMWREDRDVKRLTALEESYRLNLTEPKGRPRLGLPNEEEK